MFNKLFGACLLVDDFEKSLHFYKNVLGLTVNSQEGKFANFKLGETELAIFQKDEAVGMFPKKYMGKGGSVSLAFQVPSVEKAVKELKAKGIKIIEGPKKTAWGQVVAYFLDPDDNIWEVSQP
jgi:lactoylglutathione lyase